ncbi:MAG: isoprenylcysteine carboxylmethyltransferase family protein [Anaerolineaceae bacterium]|nr:isoprenylcysteine carboxylmethyltransferase family protein [Anaerolineaceae bacterium]
MANYLSVNIPGGFWGSLASMAVYGVIHSLLASHWVKRGVERHFGAAAQRGYRLFFVLQAGILGLAVLALAYWLPDAPLYSIPMPWLLLTLAIQALATWGLIRGVQQTGALDFLGLSQVFKPQPLTAPSEPRKMVMQGFYQYVRHPLYSFSMILVWLMPVVSWNTLGLMIGASIYLLVGTLFEERKLLHEFGEAYADYCRRTPMFIPGLRFSSREKLP